mmetsp:Transcript_29952/g.85600  ORF Transcript_29952/g.85600 Transcript_29952/m.85600 type:complete len:266 (+) Transcript_29952:3347-4144(+)
MHVNGDQRLELGAVHFGAQVGEAHADEVGEHLDELLARRAHDRLVFVARHANQGVLEVRCPHELDTQQADLRDALVAKVADREAVHELADLQRGNAALAAHRALHLCLQRQQPILDVADGHHGHLHVDGLLGVPHHALDLDDLLLVHLIELDAADGVKEFLEVLLDALRVAALRQDLQQHWVGREVEARELVPLALQVALQRFLACLESRGQHWQHLLQHVVLAARHHELHLRRLLHDFDPVLVDLLELLGLHGHLLGDVSTCEH